MASDAEGGSEGGDGTERERMVAELKHAAKQLAFAPIREDSAIESSRGRAASPRSCASSSASPKSQRTSPTPPRGLHRLSDGDLALICNLDELSQVRAAIRDAEAGAKVASPGKATTAARTPTRPARQPNAGGTQPLAARRLERARSEPAMVGAVGPAGATPVTPDAGVEPALSGSARVDPVAFVTKMRDMRGGARAHAREPGAATVVSCGRRATHAVACEPEAAALRSTGEGRAAGG